MAQTNYTLKDVSNVEYPVAPIPGSYTGYFYEDELSVQKLLGKDPARADKNETLQSTGRGAKSAELDIYATEAQYAALLGLLWTTVTHNDGIRTASGATGTSVVVLGVSGRVHQKIAGHAVVWKIHLKLREV